MDATRLQVSSQRWMTTGLEAFSAGEEFFDFAVHHHGVALEHLLKAYLASLHPALIAEAKDFDSMLHATGHSGRATRPSTRSKTIGLAEAFSRVRKLLPRQITVTDQEFEPVLAARNGVAHAGHHDPAESRQVLTTCMRIADPLLLEVGLSSDEYWGDYGDLHRQLIDQHVNELAITTAAKIAHARAAYQRRINGLMMQQRIQLVAGLSAVSMHATDCDKQVDCPAYEGKGWLHGVVHTEFEAMKRKGYTGVYTKGFETLFARSYDCSLCGLMLEGEEIRQVGLPTEVLIEVDESVPGHELDKK
ncbi:hypothetical protein [Amycolatopsis kentuckyensis]|uniref:hypothetical protein n=1 Tax=Amycolatopsis kentuckyensis TaxID=218823 RepID=UPI00117784A8|nr:hypothetical protein [Amycolatopsis kentuckyensis]